jgi:hypothetical protein
MLHLLFRPNYGIERVIPSFYPANPQINSYLAALALALRFLVSPLRLAEVAACSAASSSGRSEVSRSGSSAAAVLPSRRPTERLYRNLGSLNSIVS